MSSLIVDCWWLWISYKLPQRWKHWMETCFIHSCCRGCGWQHDLVVTASLSRISGPMITDNGRSGKFWVTLVPMLWCGVEVDLLTTHEVAWYVSLLVSACPSVRRYLRKPWRRKFIFTQVAYLHSLRVEFVYEGHRVKVKVTGAKKVEDSYSHNVKLPSAVTPVLSNIEPWCLHAAWTCRVRRIEWCNCHLCHTTGSEHA